MAAELGMSPGAVREVIARRTAFDVSMALLGAGWQAPIVEPDAHP